MEFVAWSLTWMANLVDACTGVVVGLGIIAASARATRLGLRRGMDVEETMAQIRLSLGRWLALSLELALAADILRSVVAPTWDDIGKLGAHCRSQNDSQLLPRERDRARRHASVPTCCLTSASGRWPSRAWELWCWPPTSPGRCGPFSAEPTLPELDC